MDLTDNPEEFVAHLGMAQHAVHAFVLRLVPHWNDAEEIMQETNIVLWRKFHEFDPGTDFVRWACQVAYFEVLKWHRARSRDRLRLGEDVLNQLSDELLVEPEQSAPLASTKAVHRRAEQCRSSLVRSAVSLGSVSQNGGPGVRSVRRCHLQIA